MLMNKKNKLRNDFRSRFEQNKQRKKTKMQRQNNVELWQKEVNLSLMWQMWCGGK